jgi:TolB-like protein
MQAYFDVGERGLALRQYELCRDMLGDELQIVPGEETEALRRRLMDQPVPLSKAKLNGDHVVPELAEAIDLGGIRPDERPLVAVLPFDAIGADAAVDSFCDGLTEDIITGLSRISAIRVVARNTMFTYKGRAVDIRGVGRDLGARYVLEGSVRTSAKRTRVSAQLIDGVSGHHIWAEQIDRANAEIFDLQNEITQSIVASAQTQLILNEGRSPVPGNEPEQVSRLLARSWQRFLRLTNESLAECATLAERVLELDPRNAMAHRMLAIAIYHLVYMGFVAWTDLTVDRLFEHAKMSIEYEGADEYCHWAMGCAYLLKGQHELAAASLRRALEINPNCSLAFGSMGTVLAWGGKYDASVQSNELALRVNAQDPSNFFRHFGLSLAHYLASRYDQALPHARSVVQARPTWWLGQIIYAASISHIGGEDEARRIASELTSSRREMPASLAALPFANANDREHLAGDLRKVGLLA